MIPDLITIPGSPWAVLPPGVHKVTLGEVQAAFATNARRRELYAGLCKALKSLRSAGCQTIYLDGSYITSKPIPGDFDACWDPTGVDDSKLNPVFLDFRNQRAAQKAAFQGEFFPSSMMCLDVGQTFVDFFQRDRFTGSSKGIVCVSLTDDPLLSNMVQR